MFFWYSEKSGCRFRNNSNSSMVLETMTNYYLWCSGSISEKSWKSTSQISATMRRCLWVLLARVKAILREEKLEKGVSRVRIL